MRNEAGLQKCCIIGESSVPVPFLLVQAVDLQKARLGGFSGGSRSELRRALRTGGSNSYFWKRIPRLGYAWKVGSGDGAVCSRATEALNVVIVNQLKLLLK